jgi:hypothetical protein
MHRFVQLLPLVFVLFAGCPVKNAVDTPDYQKITDEANWEFRCGDDFTGCLAHELRDYKLELARENGSFTKFVLRVLADGKAIYSFSVHLESVFLERDGVLYHADFSANASGCMIVAHDLKANKQLWKTDLKGIGPVAHSKYANEVRMMTYKSDALMIYGKESFGKYIEILELKSGKTVGHKLFKDKD